MSYSAQVIQRARKQLAQQKEDLNSRYQHELYEAYAKVPRLREIDIQLRQTVILAAQAAFAKGTDGREALALCEQKNLQLQEERKALLAANFPAGYLEERSICDRCGGKGYVGSEMCGCLKELCRQEQKKELQKLTTGAERFDAFRLDYYPNQIDPAYGASPRQVMERVLAACRRYAAEFDGSGANLLFVGGTGLGKTFLSACIANEVADRGFSVAYESAPVLFEKLNKNQFSPDEQSRQDAANISGCDLLIIDDLGTELTNNFTTAALYSLLNERLLENKSILVSTNLTAEEIARRYSPQIASRLQGNFRGLVFVGNDIRVMKNRGA